MRHFTCLEYEGQDNFWLCIIEVKGIIYYKELIPQMIVTDKGGRSALSVSNDRDWITDGSSGNCSGDCSRSNSNQI